MEQLRKEGWYINESQTAKLFTDEILPKTSKEILKLILDEDLRKFAEPSIVNLTRKEENVFEGPCVLQLVRYRNVSVPRIKEEMNQADPAHSIIRLFLTDGHTSVSALILESIPGINADTPPGTKILLAGKVPVEGMFLNITKKDVKVLGGKVGEMIEKWRLERNSVRAEGYTARSAAGKGTGAPKWVSFVKRNEKNIKLDKDFKANSAMPTNTKEGDEEDEFKKNREQVLKEIGRDVAKKFVSPNIEKPAPKEKVAPVVKEPKEPKPRKEFKRRGRKNSEDGPDVDVGEYANHKPSGPATLFDFIGGKEASTEKNDVRKMTEETQKMSVERPQKSFDRGVHGGGQKGGRGAPGAANPRRHDNERPKYGEPPRNNTRPGKNSNYERKDDNRRKPYDQQGPPAHPSGKYNRNDRPNTGPAPPSAGRFNQNDRPNTGPSAPPAGRFNQNDRLNTGPSAPPAGRFNQNDNRDSGPSHSQQHGRFNRNDRSAHPQPSGRFQQRENQNQAPQEHTANFPRSGNRGNPQRNNDFQRGPPRGNQNRQPGPSFNRNDFPSIPTGPQWRVGSQCLAAWTDGNLYPATVTAMFPDGNCMVRYNEYGNTQTIPVDFLIMA